MYNDNGLQPTTLSYNQPLPSLAQASPSSKGPSYGIILFLGAVVIIGVVVYRKGVAEFLDSIEKIGTYVKNGFLALYVFIINAIDWINMKLNNNDDDSPREESKPSPNVASTTVSSSSAHSRENHEKDDIRINSRKNKSGYCYIGIGKGKGDIKGQRVCAYVNETDKCMSGDIFPTRDICINPSLR
jgi:hypothetical protein